ncbi:MAG: hypothetical protein WC130_12665 [Kiritimatiellia bacterium]
MAFFTKENSKLYAAKALETRRQLAEDRRITLESLRSPTDDFREDMLKGVRAQVRLIMNRIDRELEQGHLDTKALRDLGDTLARFEAMEQKLSMRAGPGSLKPTAKPAPRRSAVTVDDDPRPVEAPMEKPAAQISQDEAPAPAAAITPPSPDPAPAPAQAAPAVGLDGLPPIEMPV